MRLVARNVRICKQSYEEREILHINFPQQSADEISEPLFRNFGKKYEVRIVYELMALVVGNTSIVATEGQITSRQIL